MCFCNIFFIVELDGDKLFCLVFNEIIDFVCVGGCCDNVVLDFFIGLKCFIWFWIDVVNDVGCVYDKFIVIIWILKNGWGCLGMNYVVNFLSDVVCLFVVGNYVFVFDVCVDD